MPAVQRNAVVAFSRDTGTGLISGKPQFVATARDAVNLARDVADFAAGSVAVQFIDRDGERECATLLAHFGAVPACILTEVV